MLKTSNWNLSSGKNVNLSQYSNNIEFRNILEYCDKFENNNDILTFLFTVAKNLQENAIQLDEKNEILNETIDAVTLLIKNIMEA